LSATKVLQPFGLSNYEARAYLTLLRHGALNGYELSKRAQIPRANVYAVLGRLVARNAALRLDRSTGTQYVAVPAKRLLARIDAVHQKNIREAQRTLAAISSPSSAAVVVNSRGYDTLLEHARDAINNSTKRLEIALRRPESLALRDEIDKAMRRGVDVVILCMEACANECDGCKGQVHRYRVSPELGSRWLIIIADSVSLVAGEVVSRNDAFVLSTEQELIVMLASLYINSTIALAALVSDLGPKFSGAVSSQTRAKLASLGSRGDHASFMKYLNRLMKEPVGPSSSTKR